MHEMKFLANENFPRASFRILRAEGLDIEHIGETNPSVSDEEVMKMALQEERIIITFDNDYGELVFKRRMPAAGVIFLRIQDFPPELPAELIKNLLSIKEISVKGFFTVLEEGKLRQRKIQRASDK